MPAGSTDQDNAKLAMQIPGSLAVMTLLQLRAERLDLQALDLDGITASAATIANGTYPFPIRICALLPSEPTPAAARFVAHLRSAAGRSIVESLGAKASE
jgi:phosphate transport system substrate-binding protein